MASPQILCNTLPIVPSHRLLPRLSALSSLVPLLLILSAITTSNNVKRIIVFSSANTTTSTSNLSSLHPIVLIPGIAGSGLYASRDSSISIPECGTSSSNSSYPWYRIWVSLSQLLPPRHHQECWVASVSLLPPNCTNDNRDDGDADGCELYSEGEMSTYRDRKGIRIRSDVPGTTTGFEYLDYFYGYGVFGTKYFADFVAALKAVGYKELNNLFGFPFDWRFPPWQSDFKTLKQLIEAAKAQNGNRKVVLISHSLGSVIVTYFLNTYVSEEWKHDHIHTFVSMAGAFGGSPKVVRSLLSGYNGPASYSLFNAVNISLIPNDLIRSFSQHTGSMYALIPSEEVYGLNYPMVTIEKNNSSFTKATETGANSGRSSIGGGYSGVSGNDTGAVYTGKVHLRGLDGIHRSQRNQKRKSYFEHGHNANDEYVNKHLVDEDKTKEPPIVELMNSSDITAWYSATNWTLLLPPRMRALAAQARLKMPYALQDPGVPVYCIWTKYDMPKTEIQYIYNSRDFDIEPSARFTFGDNTLPIQSLDWCSRWRSTKFHFEYPNLDHMLLLQDSKFNKFVVSLLTDGILTATTQFSRDAAKRGDKINDDFGVPTKSNNGGSGDSPVVVAIA